jgi:hypothetical protein
MMTLRPVPSRGRVGGIVSSCCGSMGDCNPLWMEWLAPYDKLTLACIFIRHICSRALQYAGSSWPRPCRSETGMRVRRSLVGDLSWSRGTDPVPERPLGQGCKPCFFPTRWSVGITGLGVWTKSRPTRMVVRSRRGLELARMTAGSGPIRIPESVDRSLWFLAVIDQFTFYYHIIHKSFTIAKTC